MKITVDVPDQYVPSNRDVTSLMGFTVADLISVRAFLDRHDLTVADLDDFLKKID